MSKARYIAAAGLVAVAASSALAQGGINSQCAAGSPILGSGNQGGQACQKGIDIFTYLAPQFGTAIAGGNPLLGATGTLGRTGRFTFGVRGSVVQGSVPDISIQEDFTGEPAEGSQSNIKTDKGPIPMISAEGALGLFGGITVSPGLRVLSLDAMANLFYVPDFDKEFDNNGTSVNVGPSGSRIKFGFGGRVGLVNEGGARPALTFSLMKRDLPNSEIQYKATSNDDFLRLQDWENKTTAWRITAGKNLGVLGIALGYGKDKYESSARLDYSISTGCTPTCTPSNGQTVRFSSDVDATNMFADVMLNLKVFKIIGEVGQVKVNGLDTNSFYNSFDDEPDASRLYGSIGLRFGWR